MHSPQEILEKEINYVQLNKYIGKHVNTCILIDELYPGDQ